MNNKNELILIPGVALAILLAIVGSVYVKTTLGNYVAAQEPLTKSISMLASFVVFLLVFGVVIAPVLWLQKHYRHKKVPVRTHKKVTYGYHTPVPR